MMFVRFGIFTIQYDGSHMESNDASLRQEFIEKIGLVAQNEGFARIAGRIMGLMVYDGRPYSFSELAGELQVSRGSISSNARFLEDRGIIERVARPGDRQDYFRLADDPYSALLRDAAERAGKAKRSIDKTLEQLPLSERGARKRLQRYSHFYSAVEQGLLTAKNNVDPR